MKRILTLGLLALLALPSLAGADALGAEVIRQRTVIRAPVQPRVVVRTRVFAPRTFATNVFVGAPRYNVGLVPSYGYGYAAPLPAFAPAFGYAAPLPGYGVGGCGCGGGASFGFASY